MILMVGGLYSFFLDSSIVPLSYFMCLLLSILASTITSTISVYSLDRLLFLLKLPLVRAEGLKMSDRRRNIEDKQ